MRIEFVGEYDLARRDEVRQVLAGIDGTHAVVFDVRAVDYADSSFLSELGKARAKYPDCLMTIDGASPMLKKVLTLVSFDKLFTITEDQ